MCAMFQRRYVRSCSNKRITLNVSLVFAFNAFVAYAQRYANKVNACAMFQRKVVEALKTSAFTHVCVACSKTTFTSVRNHACVVQRVICAFVYVVLRT